MRRVPMRLISFLLLADTPAAVGQQEPVAKVQKGQKRSGTDGKLYWFFCPYFITRAFSGDHRPGRTSSAAGGVVQRPRCVTGCTTAATITHASRGIAHPLPPCTESATMSSSFTSSTCGYYAWQRGRSSGMMAEGSICLGRNRKYGACLQSHYRGFSMRALARAVAG